MRSLSVPQPQERGYGQDILGQILAYARILAPVSDYFLIDTLQGGRHAVQNQPVAGFVGITGDVCDWEMAARIVAESPRPVILAGGIGENNAFEAIRTVRPAGLDSCTRTNAIDGNGRPIRFQKDLQKVALLVTEVRRAEAAGL
jgi:phosphoribosylanthranilate isomerase